MAEEVEEPLPPSSELVKRNRDANQLALQSSGSANRGSRQALLLSSSSSMGSRAELMAAKAPSRNPSVSTLTLAANRKAAVGGGGSGNSGGPNDTILGNSNCRTALQMLINLWKQEEERMGGDRSVVIKDIQRPLALPFSHLTGLKPFDENAAMLANSASAQKELVLMMNKQHSGNSSSGRVGLGISASDDSVTTYNKNNKNNNNTVSLNEFDALYDEAQKSIHDKLWIKLRESTSMKQVRWDASEREKTR